MPEMSIEAVLKEHTPRLMSLPGVVGTGEGECGGVPCIKVLIVEKSPELVRQIGTTLEGYPVEFIESGEIKALDPN